MGDYGPLVESILELPQLMGSGFLLPLQGQNVSLALFYIVGMKGHILTIGDELLTGKVVNTNASAIGQWLTSGGVEVTGCSVLPDNEKFIAGAIKESVAKSDLVIITGGLGPTRDDVTRQGIAAYLGAGGRKSHRAKKWLQQFLTSKNKKMSPGQSPQTWVPTGCKPLQNKLGTACGLIFKTRQATVYTFPGVPGELMPMLSDYVSAHLSVPDKITEKKIWTWGWPESRQLLALKNWQPKKAHKFSSLPTDKGVVLSLSTRVPDNRSIEVNNVLNKSFESLVQCIPEENRVYPIGSEIPHGVIQLLTGLQSSVTTAESCTGGAVSFLITSIPGSSSVFKNSFVTYANESKIKSLEVPGPLLKKHGAVSEQTVRAMVQGGVKMTGADYCCATTGIAGPDGGTKTKPVGTVWIGAGTRSQVVTKQLRLGRTRDEIRWRAAYGVLFLLNQFLQKVLDEEKGSPLPVVRSPLNQGRTVHDSSTKGIE